MGEWIIKLVLCAWLLTSASACRSTSDTVDAHLTEINTSAADFRNQAILLNILRAREGAPLSFVNVASVPTIYSDSLNAGLPTFQVGPLAVGTGRPFGFGSDTLRTGFGGQTQPTFNNLVGKEFTQAATTAISALQLMRFARDGFPIDLLMMLMTSKIRIELVEGPFVMHTSFGPIPRCPLGAKDFGGVDELNTFSCFEKIRSFALKGRLDIQAKLTKNPTKGSDAGKKPSSDKSTREYTLDQDAELCFEASEAELRWLFSKANFQVGLLRCNPDRRQDVDAPPAGGQIVRAEFRSLVGVYRHLGELLGQPRYARISLTFRDRHPKPALIVREDTGGPCFVSAEYRGRRYCVPDPALEPNHGPTVFAILDQIQNNNTDLSKVPQPTVVTLGGALR